MSDQKIAEYYPSLNDPAKGGWVPCLRCGAMVHIPLRGLHVEWHEQERK